MPLNLQLCLLLLGTLMCQQHIAAAKPIPETGTSDEADRLNSHLSYNIMRFTNIAKTQNEYAVDLQRLLQRLQDVRSGDNLAAKKTLLANYDSDLATNTRAYLRQQMDMQWLNEELHMERWYLQRLRQDYADGEPMALQLDELLSQYERTLTVADFDEKYERFVTIRDDYSSELVELMDAEPETLPMLNAHLQLLSEFLQYLLVERRSGEFATDIARLLDVVESSISAGNGERKRQALSYFDDVGTKFGRFLSNNIDEFFVNKFS